MSDKYALTQEQRDDITHRAVDLMLDKTQRALTPDEQRLVDLHLHVQTVDERIRNMSAIVQRTIGTTIDVGIALSSHVEESESTNEHASVTVAWVLQLLARYADPTGTVVSVESLLEAMPDSFRLDAEDFGFDPDAQSGADV